LHVSHTASKLQIQNKQQVNFDAKFCVFFKFLCLFLKTAMTEWHCRWREFHFSLREVICCRWWLQEASRLWNILAVCC